MHIAGENSNKIFLLLIFAIMLCIYPLYTKAEIRTFTHVEEKDDYLPKAPRVQSLKTYDDGTAVARIVRTKTANAAKVCFFEMFSLRIIYLNGTVDEKDIDLEKLGIPPINYCFFAVEYALVKFLDYFLIRKNQILITYVNTTNPDDFATYEDWGMVIDFDGNGHDRIFFAPRYINATSIQLVPNSDPIVTLNVNREKGFLRTYSVRGTGTIRQEWQQYKIELDGTFTKLTSGVIPLYSSNLVGALKRSFSTLISTVDEGYTILFGISISNDDFTAKNPLLPLVQLSVLPIGYNQTVNSPLILYQTTLPNLNITGIGCGIAFAGIGQSCVLTLLQTDPAGLAPVKIFFVKIDFLSSGSVTNVAAVFIPINLFYGWSVQSLQFGGFLLTNIVRAAVKENASIYGYLFNGVDIIPWEFPEPVPNTEGMYGILLNNTLLVPQLEDGNTWKFLATDLPKFFGDKDNGYFNVNVEATFPAINGTIRPNLPYKISINFYNPVKLSNGKLSIYQVVGDQQYLLRQSIPSIKCSIENNGKTVSADALESTFSIFKGKYFIMVDNNLVIDIAYGEPQLGIRENIWTFTTEEKKDTFAPDAYEAGLFRLTSNGTQAFENLSQDERHDFFDILLEELSVAIPVGLERLTTNRMTQLDSSFRYLISIGILATIDEYDNNAVSIIKIIDTLVKRKDQSSIGLSRIAGYLDESYGFKQLPNLWKVYKIRFIVLFPIIVGLLIVSFIIAQRKSSEGNNLAIIQLFLIIFDLQMDIFFISNNAGDVPVLYIPSIMFFVTPIAINTALVFHIIAQENIKPKFYHWFIKNGNVAGVFTVLAIADIKTLNILQSNFAGHRYFKAPFSNSAQSKIFWFTFLNIFIEDLPQVIIQIYYKRNTVFYGIIPLLALISSTINLAINVVDTLYQETYRIFIPEYVPNNPDDEDDFVDSITSFTDKKQN